MKTIVTPQVTRLPCRKCGKQPCCCGSRRGPQGFQGAQGESGEAALSGGVLVFSGLLVATEGADIYYLANAGVAEAASTGDQRFPVGSEGQTFFRMTAINRRAMSPADPPESIDVELVYRANGAGPEITLLSLTIPAGSAVNTVTTVEGSVVIPPLATFDVKATGHIFADVGIAVTLQ
jgi:hypothetical protein